MIRTFLVISLLLCGFDGYSQSNSANHAIAFEIKNFGVTVEGSFSAPTGIINFDLNNPGNSIFDVTISAKSINTGIELRDNHLRKREYFDVETYPHILFKSTLISKDAKSDKWIVTGDLTIKNVTKQISFPFAFRDDILLGEFTIDRTSFNVGSKSLTMSEDVMVKLKVRNQKL
jgi:polyisoprenoid-binding protein YceI